MQEALSLIESNFRKKKIPAIRVGDTIRVHQRIKEGKKERIQVFEGLVIRYRKVNSLSAFITVRKITSGVGVEKSWFVHSPNVVKIQIVKRSKVRRAFLSYMRKRAGKSARMSEQQFDKVAANQSDERTAAQIAEEEKTKIKTEVDQGGDKAAKEDAMNQPDREQLKGVVKEEDRQAEIEDPSSSDDATTTSKPTKEEKTVDMGDDEQQLAAEEFQGGVDKIEDKIDKNQ